MSWNANKLNFSVEVGAGARGLQAMVPARSDAGQLTGITRGGNQVAYTSKTIKGVEYAVFAAAAGDYVASYEADTAAPAISGLTATPNTDGTATVSWTTDEPATSRVDYGTSPGALDLNATEPGLTTSHSVELTGLEANTTYHYRVTSTDADGNAATSPQSADPPASFETPEAGLHRHHRLRLRGRHARRRDLRRPDGRRRGHPQADRGRGVLRHLPARRVGEQPLDRRQFHGIRRQADRRRRACQPTDPVRSGALARVRGHLRRGTVPARRLRTEPGIRVGRPLGDVQHGRRKHSPSPCTRGPTNGADVNVADPRLREPHRHPAPLPYRVGTNRTSGSTSTERWRPHAGGGDRRPDAPGGQRLQQRWGHGGGRLAAHEPLPVARRLRRLASSTPGRAQPTGSS